MYDPRIRFYTVVLSPAQVANATCAEQTFAVSNVGLYDIVIGCIKPTAQAGLGIAGVRVPSDGNVAINFVNATAAPITPTPGETYTIAVMAAQP